MSPTRVSSGAMTKKLALLEVLDSKWDDGSRPKDLFDRHIAKSPTPYASDIIAGLTSKARKVQNGCAELASLLSEKHPELLYDHFDLFEANLGSKAKVLRWEAVCTIGNLARIDREGRCRKVMPAIAPLLQNESIVLQGHAVRALTKVAVAFPDVAPSILDKLIAAGPSFPGNRVGYLVEAMGAFGNEPALAKKARKFAGEHAESEIRSVATKARKALKALAAT